MAEWIVFTVDFTQKFPKRIFFHLSRKISSFSKRKMRRDETFGPSVGMQVLKSGECFAAHEIICTFLRKPSRKNFVHQFGKHDGAQNSYVLIFARWGREERARGSFDLYGLKFTSQGTVP